jgi:hypothetical protein
MYAGHFAAALAIKAKEPLAPAWAVLLGTGFLDVLFGVFVLFGSCERSPRPEVGLVSSARARELLRSKGLDRPVHKSKCTAVAKHI